ncbi:MAG TPA: hypothetical protein VFQ20_09360 [Burkholderiaceae bacterium]|nr:hypothetical protein [Burkholderiaceae bacterium]
MSPRALLLASIPCLAAPALATDGTAAPWGAPQEIELPRSEGRWLLVLPARLLS